MGVTGVDYIMPFGPSTGVQAESSPLLMNPLPGVLWRRRELSRRTVELLVITPPYTATN
jgi:hypothetical protein